MKEDDESDQEVFKRDVLYVRAFLFVWVLVTLCVLLYLAAGPMKNMLFVYQRSDGTSVDNTYGLGWWPQTLFFVTNYLVILILCSIVADPDSPARVDLHQLASYIAIVGNGVVFFAFLIGYLFLVNSSLAGGLPYNDYRWCCVYYTDAPQYCPNTAMCDLVPTLLGSDLRVNFEFKIIWIFSIVFFSFATANRVFNLMLRETGAVVPPNKKEWEGYTLAILTVFSNVGFYCYWAGWPLKNTLHVHGYPTLGKGVFFFCCTFFLKKYIRDSTRSRRIYIYPLQLPMDSPMYFGAQYHLSHFIHGGIGLQKDTILAHDTLLVYNHHQHHFSCSVTLFTVVVDTLCGILQLFQFGRVHLQ